MTNYLQSAAGALAFARDKPWRAGQDETLFDPLSRRRLINGLKTIFFKASFQHLVCAHVRGHSFSLMAVHTVATYLMSSWT